MYSNEFSKHQITFLPNYHSSHSSLTTHFQVYSIYLLKKIKIFQTKDLSLYHPSIRTCVNPWTYTFSTPLISPLSCWNCRPTCDNIATNNTRQKNIIMHDTIVIVTTKSMHWKDLSLHNNIATNILNNQCWNNLNFH